MRCIALATGLLAAALTVLVTSANGASAQESTSANLTPVQVHTVAQSRCGSGGLSTAGADCRGFDAREIRESTDTLVVGFENNQEIGEKHVLQVVAVFDLTQISIEPDSAVSRATLGYAEASTTRRTSEGESDYGILSSCNTRLGVPLTGWDGSVDTLVATTPALTAGVTPATTGDDGSWDVTPQIQEWLAAGEQTGTLVMGADDESPDPQGQSMCLSYVFDLGLNIEVAPTP